MSHPVFRRDATPAPSRGASSQAEPATVADQAARQGLHLHQAGRLPEAEACYRRALAAQPGHPDALHLLGVVALQCGRPAEAATLARQAIAASPTQPTFWNTLGVAERTAGQLVEAARCFTRAVEIAPAYAEAWANLAAAHQLTGDADAEDTALARLLALQPDQARVWGRRGVLAYQADRFDNACIYLTRAAEIAPGDPEIWSNLGAAQLRLGRYDEAETSQRRAVAAGPDVPLALNNLGNVLVARSRWDEAATVLAQAVERAPDDANVWINFGHALKGLERHQEAGAAYEQALSLRPNDPVAIVGLGDALHNLGDNHAAIARYRAALPLAPDDPDLHEHLGIAFQRLGRLEESAAAFRRCLALDPDRPRAHSYLIFVLDLMAGAEAEAGIERRRWSARFGRGAASRPAPHTNQPDADRPLRVGYVSADFKHHSAAYAFLAVLRGHDRSRFTLVCYSGVTVPDEITDQIRALADVWHDTAYLPDDDLEALIRSEQIDILVDLSGHSGGNRLPVFARQPAPVQVTAWGYATGTGLDAVQYFLADPVVVPPEEHARYAEEVVSLPSVVCYDVPSYAPPVSPLPATTRGLVTFGAFNRLPKISDETVATWGRVMAAVPTSRLVVKCGGADISPECDRLLGRLAAQGIDEGRVTLLGRTAHPDHLAAHAEIDLMLDTFPHTGGITTLDALLMGVPVVTLLGVGVAGRLSASFLTELGLEDLIARSPDEYVEIAARLAGDLDRLTHERATLRERLLASPIADGRRYTEAVEGAYREMWRRWCRESATGGETSAAHDDGRGTSR